MRLIWTGLVVLALAACSSTANNKEEVVADLGTDVAGDVAVPDSAESDVPDQASTPDSVDLVEDGPVTDSDTSEPPQFPPRKLPFDFARPMPGDPIPESDVLTFTKKVTGAWKKIDYFRWLLRTSTGVDPSSAKEDYLAWHNDVNAVKAGDTVTFKHMGGEHNMWIPSSKILSEAIGGCILTGDWATCKVTEQYCKGLTAVVKGFIWDENDPAPYLMARAVFPFDHEFTMDEMTWQDDGRKKAVEFSYMYHVEDGWNAHTFEWPHNPTWGYMWVTNMRSKDDVCAIVRTTTFLPYIVADAPFDFVKEACQETLDNMVGFNKDIVDYDYNIRTKDPDGTARIVTEQDLGSYNWYAGMDPLNECPARLATDLIAYGEHKTNDCGTGFGSSYELIAADIHYYNYPIIWNYHMAALGNAMVYGDIDAAKKLMQGMADRMDAYLSPNTKEPGAENGGWKKDMAVLLVQAASMGLPLKPAEARLVHEHWLQAVVEFEAWERWDLWSDSVPEGEYGGGGGFRPSETDAGIPIEAFTMFMEYCNSPFKNPAGTPFVDCSIVKDMNQWGE